VTSAPGPPIAAGALGPVLEPLAGLVPAAVPPAALERARLVVLDTVGAILGGAADPEPAALARRLPPGVPATLLGAGRSATPRDAAFWNATTGCMLELSEGSRYTRSPTAIQIVPAALAEAEAGGHAGPAVLVATVVGYEVAGRVARAFRLRDAHHPLGTWGAMGAAAAVGWLRGLDARRLGALVDLAGCLGLATSLATVREGATVRNAYAGLAASHGLLAADLLEAGFTPLADGAARAYGGLLADPGDATALSTAPGGPAGFEIERGYFKLHACYRHAHAALDALGAILEAESPRPEPEAAAGVAVETYDFAAALTNPDPDSALAAQFSIPHALAARWVLGHAGPAAFEPAALGDPRVAALRRRITVREDPALTAKVPGRRPARVTVELRSGRTVSRLSELPRGEPENPLTPAELEAKFLDLAARALGREGAGRAREALAGLADAGPLGPILATLSGPPTRR
jgi:2-methylcitrate dehydratase PrpD